MPEMSLKAGLEAMDVAEYLRRRPDFLKDDMRDHRGRAWPIVEDQH